MEGRKCKGGGEREMVGGRGKERSRKGRGGKGG